MRSSLLLFFIAASTFMVAKAQPVLTPASLNPVNGDVFYGHRVNDISVGLSGAGVAWNFAALKEIRLDTTSYYTCDATPFCIIYEGNNAKVNDAENLHVNTGINRLSVMAGRNIVFGDNVEGMRYGHKYTYSHNDTFRSQGSSSLIYHKEMDTYTYDAYGSISLPTGFDTGVVRVHTIANTKDSSALGVTSSTLEYYTWYRPGFHNPLLIVRYDNTVPLKDRPRIAYASWYSDRAGNISAADADALASSVVVYPNRASDELYIKFTLQNIQVATIYVTDLSGRVIATIKTKDLVEGANLVTYPLNFFPPGTYFVHLASSIGRISKQVVIESQ